MTNQKTSDTERIVALQKVTLGKLDDVAHYLHGLAMVTNSLHDLARIGVSAQNSEESLLHDTLEKSHIREVYLTDIFPHIDEISVPIGSINEESGHANHVDLLYVNAIARVLRAERIFEFGTYIGRTTFHLTFASPNARVFTLNLPPEKDSRIAPYLGSYFKGTDREARIELILTDSREFDASEYKQSMDMVFVDGDHNYEMIGNDTKKAFELLKPGGTIVWHDFAAKSPGVLKFFEEFSASTPVFRIKNTCLVVYIDGVDVEKFSPPPRRNTLVSD